MRMLKILLCSGMLAACTAEGPKHSASFALPGSTRVSGVPFHPQDGYGCGPSSLAMVLGWTGLDIRPQNLRTRLDEQGDPRPALARTAIFYGRLAYPIAGMRSLLAELESGHPVLIVQNLGIESRPIWNCSVAIGLDRARDALILNTGNQASKRVGARTFERLWAETDQWGLVVLKPGDVPGGANLGGYLSAARALEQAGRYWEAVLAYDAALATWPDNSDTFMGLGTSLYRLGDPRGAADAYRTAAMLAGDPTSARAALARLSSEQASLEAALPVAQERH